MTGTTLNLKPSTLAYLSKPAIRTAVDALLAVSSTKIPTGLGWTELESFFNAHAAAELTKSEWAPMVLQGWQLIWDHLEKEGWEPAAPEDLAYEEEWVTPANCWTGKGFSTWHSRGDHYLYTAVKITHNAIEIGFSLELEEEGLVTSADDDFKWSDEGDWNGYMVARRPVEFKTLEFPLDAFRQLAISAMERVRQQCRYTLP